MSNGALKNHPPTVGDPPNALPVSGGLRSVSSAAGPFQPTALPDRPIGAFPVFSAM